MAMVVNAHRGETEVGGHISSYASMATLYEVAYNHFFRGGDAKWPAIRSISKATPPLAITRAPFWSIAWRKATCTISGANWRKAADCRRIRIRI